MTAGDAREIPSQYSGMDPYIGSQIWEDFHAAYIVAMRDHLVSDVRSEYVVRVEQRVYLEFLPGESRTSAIRPDLSITRPGIPPFPSTPRAAVLEIEPVDVLLPAIEQVHEYFLTIRNSLSADEVTVIELHSPGDKRAGSEGRS